MAMYSLRLALALIATPAVASPAEQARWQREAARVSITRDDWGIAHVQGKSDADAVFGAIYAQAEDDFPRIEANYLAALGRTAEAEGEDAIWRDLRQRLWINPETLQAQYRQSPLWLRALMDAWADGLNLYLATHPATKPKVLTRFKPWMALSFTEGSIGGDIERADLGTLASFYGGAAPRIALAEDARRLAEPTGSNGIAIGPNLSASGHALLWINPHTSFFFRSELEMRSDAGLHAYGASTWGQFFLYQGFNERLGWMHTSSGVDAVDAFAETIARKDGRLFYRYGGALRPITAQQVTIRYRRPDGTLASRVFTTFATHHGPIVRAEGDRWIALALMNRPIPALKQSWLRTKARDWAGYRTVAALQANSSNNTLYADADGNIAYLHPQFVPRRDDRFDYRGTVDGSDPATDWRGPTPLADLPQLTNPATGWLYNSNDWPWTAAGPMSQHAADFPRYMDQAGPNPRGSHALELLGKAKAMTPQSLTALAFDPHLTAFEPILAKLFAAYDALPATDPRRERLAAPIALLRPWDKRWSADSVPTSLAIFFGDALWAVAEPRAKALRMPGWDWIARDATADQFLMAIAAGANRLTADWGSIHVPWGRINRFQRVSAAITPTFSDSAPSIAVPFTSSRWGSLASFGARQYPGTKSWYGTSGNSFVAAVEFGPKVRAWAVSAGGESGDPGSAHFDDQAGRYASGALRRVYFYPEDLTGHIERIYHPGAAF